MPAPTFSLSTFGSSPVKTSKARLEDSINNVISQLWSGVLSGSGKFFRSRSDAVSFGQAELPAAVSVVVTIESGVITWRVPFQNGDDPLFATSPYWGVIIRTDSSSIAAIRDGAILPLTNVSGTGDAITASLLPSLVAAGITSLSVESKVGFVATAANAAINPTLTIDGAEYPVRDADGGNWPIGGFVAGRHYTLRRRNTVLRVIGGDVSINDLGNGRVWHTSDANLATQTPAIGTDQISVATNTGHMTWRRMTSPPSPVNPLIHVQTLDGLWWYLSDDTSATRAAIRDAATLPLTNVSGTGDAITADLLPSIVAAGITSLSVESTVGFVATLTNPNPNPTLTIGGVTYLIRDADGGTWPANGFVVGRGYSLRRRNTVLRVISGGALVSDAMFRSADPLDEIWYAIMRTRDGTSWLGAYPDGTWMAPTAFGSIRWPGDDIVILETQAGDPILAIAPDGSLIFKQGS